MRQKSAPQSLKNFVIDVDGVMTDGQFHYSVDGKVMKIFGSDDNDALALLAPHMNILFVTGDKRGLPITKKRIEEDMKMPLHQVSTFERLAWMAERYDLSETVYMGDGIFDAMVFDKVGYAIAPQNAFKEIKEWADFVTEASGGSGAVAEAVWHLLGKFFQKPDILNLRIERGEWGAKA
jgi:3-deoxy-D-manno-octulosonate 8-phosphate phosphatase (KDO 8-P phosphatase)